MALKYVERDGLVTVTCEGQSLLIIGHVVAPQAAGAGSKGKQQGSGIDMPGGLDLPGGADLFTLHLGLPTERKFAAAAKARFRPAVRRLAATKGFQELVKLSGKKPVVLVVKQRSALAKKAKSAGARFAALHEEFKLK